MDKQYKVQVKDLHKSYGDNEVLKESHWTLSQVRLSA